MTQDDLNEIIPRKEQEHLMATARERLESLVRQWKETDEFFKDVRRSIEG